MHRSPCLTTECIGRNKEECANNCTQLAAFQEYLARVHDRYSPPGIDYRNHNYRFLLESGERGGEDHG